MSYKSVNNGTLRALARACSTKVRRGFPRKILILFFLCTCLISCARSDTAPPPASPTAYAPGVWAKDFAPGQLEAHYLKHRDEFGTITIEEYLDGARALLNAQPGRDVLEKKRGNGDILRFRVSTGEFAVMAGDGRIRTYFKADYRYWLRQ